MQSFSHSYVSLFSSLGILLVRFVVFLHPEPQHLDSRTSWTDRWQLPNRILNETNECGVNEALFKMNLFLNLLPKTQAMNDLKKQLSTTDSIIFSSFVLIFGGPKLFGITIFSRYLKRYSKQSELKSFVTFWGYVSLCVCFHFQLNLRWSFEQTCSCCQQSVWQGFPSCHFQKIYAVGFDCLAPLEREALVTVPWFLVFLLFSLWQLLWHCKVSASNGSDWKSIGSTGKRKRFISDKTVQMLLLKCFDRTSEYFSIYFFLNEKVKLVFTLLQWDDFFLFWFEWNCFFKLPKLIKK